MTLDELELPDHYQPGASLSLILEPTNAIVHLRVLRACTPFTTTQVILVKLDHEKGSSTDLRLPETLALKVYDPKFDFNRRPERFDRPRWTLEAEKKALAARKEQDEDEDSDSEDSDLEDCYSDELAIPDSDDFPGWEEWYYQLAEGRYNAETSAYNCLKAHQDPSLVQYYGSGVLDLPGRAITPRAILLECIPDAKRLDEVDPKVVPRHLIDALFETAQNLGIMGVIHADLSATNILFSPGDQPVRAVIIDFQDSYTREDESDEEWQKAVTINRGTFWLCVDLVKYLGAHHEYLGSMLEST